MSDMTMNRKRAGCAAIRGGLLIAAGTMLFGPAASNAADVPTKAAFAKIVLFQVPADAHDSFLKLAEANDTRSMNQNGVISFRLVVEPLPSHRIVGVELYRSQADSEEHEKTEAFARFIAVQKQLGVTDVKIEGVVPPS